jgi:hypothetical protein
MDMYSIMQKCILYVSLKQSKKDGEKNKVVKSVGPVAERLWFETPCRLGEKPADVPLSKARNPNCFCKSLWIRASAKMF